MPRIVKTTHREAARILKAADHDALYLALAHITASALDDAESGADTAAIVYEELARLGIVVP
jgi:hypothetical protein